LQNRGLEVWSKFHYSDTQEKKMTATKHLIVALQFALLMLILSCCKSGDTDIQAPPVLSVTPISLAGPYNPTTKAFGDVTFRGDRAMIPFGAPLTATTLNACFEYYTTASALVRASCSGEIVYMFKNDGIDDWEIHIKSAPESYWDVQHDHVSDPVVRQGDQVHAGDILGGTGKWNQAQGIGRTELGVSYSEGPQYQSLGYCPLNYGTAEFVQGHNDLLAAMNAYGFGPFTSLCLAETVKP
jgi:hypothetical protein